MSKNERIYIIEHAAKGDSDLRPATRTQKRTVLIATALVSLPLVFAIFNNASKLPDLIKHVEDAIHTYSHSDDSPSPEQ